jgi:quercetin dioxygenase-like cupin family protein
MDQKPTFIERVPKPDWLPLPREGTVGVECRVLLHRRGLAIATLRFAPRATIDEHSAGFEIDVICLAGSGFVSVGDEAAPFRAGDRVLWPAHTKHRLWTEDEGMETLMVERDGA